MTLMYKNAKTGLHLEGALVKHGNSKCNWGQPVSWVLLVQRIGSESLIGVLARQPEQVLP